jgi:hypothetical protein
MIKSKNRLLRPVGLCTISKIRSNKLACRRGFVVAANQRKTMDKRSKKLPPALKHGAYSGITLLPGEDEGAFEKLLENLEADLAPLGPLEEDIVSTMALALAQTKSFDIAYGSAGTGSIFRDLRGGQYAPRMAPGA